MRGVLHPKLACMHAFASGPRHVAHGAWCREAGSLRGVRAHSPVTGPRCPQATASLHSRPACDGHRCIQQLRRMHEHAANHAQAGLPDAARAPARRSTPPGSRTAPAPARAPGQDRTPTLVIISDHKACMPRSHPCLAQRRAAAAPPASPTRICPGFGQQRPCVSCCA